MKLSLLNCSSLVSGLGLYLLPFHGAAVNFILTVNLSLFFKAYEKHHWLVSNLLYFNMNVESGVNNVADVK